MPPKPPACNIIRNSFICRACLASLSLLRPPVQARVYSAGRRAPRRLAPSPARHGAPRARPVAQAAQAAYEPDLGEQDELQRQLRELKRTLERDRGDPNSDLIQAEIDEIDRDYAKLKDDPDLEGELDDHEPDDSAGPEADLSAFPWKVPDPDEKFVVRYFDEVAPGKYRRLKDNEEFNKVSSDLQDIESSMSALEQQMEETLEIMNQLPEEEFLSSRYKMLQRTFRHMMDAKELEVRDRPRVDIPEDPKALKVPQIGVHGSERRFIQDLSMFLLKLKDKEGHLGDRDFRDCWKIYSNCRKIIRQSIKQDLPPAVWKVFWSIFSMDRPENKNRMHHVYVLARDMTDLGLELNPFQQILALEAMFVEGWEKESITEWKRLVSTLGTLADSEADRYVFQQFWELGLRIHAHHGDLERAQMAAEKLIKSNLLCDHRVLLPLIRGSSRDENAAEQTWDLFMIIKDMLGDKIQIEDYDEIIAILLENNAIEIAFQVFVDMMYSGQVSAHGKKALPTEIGNKFFVGKWLKRLIGEGDLDGAYRVLQYVQSKGVLLDAIQLNGLIGAWLRTEEASNVKKATTLAWDMIRSRELFVESREKGEAHLWRQKLFRERWRASDEEGHNLFGETRLGFVPRATAETFYLIAESYQNRKNSEGVRQVWAAFQRGKLQTDSFMMNRLIKTALQDGKRKEAWDLYDSMKLQVPPDAHTFVFLFESLSVNSLLSSSRQNNIEDGHLARRFFREMVEASFPIEGAGRLLLTRNILFTFQKLKDWGALIVAARAMRKLLGFEPTQRLILELQIGSRMMQSRTPRDKTRLANAAVSVHNLIEIRAAMLARDGRPLETLSPDEKAGELLLVLEQMIRQKVTNQSPDGRPGPSVTDFEDAAREMGVYNVVVKAESAVIAKLKKPDMKPIWEGA